MKIVYFIFSLSFIVYLAIGLSFVFATQIVYHPVYICDLFLGFDNLMHETSSFRHPLLTVFPKLGQWLMEHFNTTSISIIIVGITSCVLAMQNVYVYRFNIKILKMNTHMALLLLIVFAGFSANLLNIITIDSFIFTSLLVVMFLYYYFNKKRNTYALFILGILQIGTTISQFFKLFFLTLKLHYTYKTALLSTIFLVAMAYLTFSVFVNDYNFLQIIEHHHKVANYSKLWNDFYSLMIGGVFLLPELEVKKLLYIDQTSYFTLSGYDGGLYRHTLVFTFTSLFLYSIYKNRNNTILKVLIPLFLLDFVIHIIFGYGNKELYLFSSHYQFIFYVALALLVKHYQNNRWCKPLVIVSSLLLLSFNLIQMKHIYEFGTIYYPFL